MSQVLQAILVKCHVLTSSSDKSIKSAMINHHCHQSFLLSGLCGTSDLFDFKNGLYLSDMYEDSACFNKDVSVLSKKQGKID